jgi:hypothetical protein
MFLHLTPGLTALSFAVIIAATIPLIRREQKRTENDYYIRKMFCYDPEMKKFSEDSILRTGKSAIMTAIEKARQKETLICLYEFYADWYVAKHFLFSRMSTEDMESFIRCYSQLFHEAESRNILEHISTHITNKGCEALDSVLWFNKFSKLPSQCSLKKIFLNLNRFKDVFSALATNSIGHNYHRNILTIVSYAEKRIEEIQEIVFQAYEGKKLRLQYENLRWVLKSNDETIGVIDELPGNLEKRILLSRREKLHNSIDAQLFEISERVIVRTFFSEYAQVLDSDYFLTSTATAA